MLPGDEAGDGPEDLLEVGPPPRTDPRDQDVLEALQKTRSVRVVLEEELQQLQSLPAGAFNHDHDQEVDQDHHSQQEVDQDHHSQQEQQHQRQQYTCAPPLRPELSGGVGSAFGGDVSASAMTTPTGSAPSSASEMVIALPGSCSGDMGAPGSPARGVSLSGGSFNGRCGMHPYTSLPVPVMPQQYHQQGALMAVQSEGGGFTRSNQGRVGVGEDWGGAGLPLHRMSASSTSTTQPTSGGDVGLTAGEFESAFVAGRATSSSTSSAAALPITPAMSKEIPCGRINSGAKTIVSLERGIAGAVSGGQDHAAAAAAGGGGGGGGFEGGAGLESAFATHWEVDEGFSMQAGPETDVQVRVGW